MEDHSSKGNFSNNYLVPYQDLPSKEFCFIKSVEKYFDRKQGKTHLNFNLTGKILNLTVDESDLGDGKMKEK